MTTKTQIVDEYQRQRDTLLGLLTRGATLLDGQEKKLPSWKATADQFREKQQKLRSSQFTIALLAEMQSGKSTLFNTVACEGRELSPVGSFIRTSGCPVHACDLGTPEAEEYALIDWRSDEELLAGFDELLRPQLADLDDRFKGRTDQDGQLITPQVAEVLKLANPSDLQLLRQAAEGELAKWKKDKAAYDTAGKGHLDVVRFALLVAEFYEHPKVRELKTRSRFTPEETGTHVRYPEDWEPRWVAGKADSFQWDEITFAFVRQARLFLHAPRLAKIGCTLVDCPGLFASRYDRQTAYDVIRSADAILYVVPGDKAVSQSQLEVLREIRSGNVEEKLRKMEEKLFFAWNIKTSQIDADRLLNHLKATLTNDGFKAATGDYFFIHAGLAFRAEQARKVLNNQFDKHTQHAIAIRAKIPLDKVGDLIWEEIAEFRRQLTKNPRIQITEDRATTDEARRLGGVDIFVGKAQESVVRRAPLSILVENGSDVVVDALWELEAELQDKEGRAKTSLDEHQCQASKAGKALQEFEAEAAVTLECLDETGPDYQLAEDFLDRLSPDLREQIAGEIAQQLDANVLTFRGMGIHVWEKMTGKLRDFMVIDGPINGPLGPVGGAIYHWWTTSAETSLEKAAKQICSDTFASRLGGRLNQWQAEIEDNQNPVFNRVIGERVERINADIQQRWQQHVPEGIPLLQGVKPPRLSPRLKDVLEFARLNPTGDIVTDELIQVGTGAGLAASGALATIVAVAVGHSAVTVFGITLFSTTQPWMWPVVAAGALAAAFGIGKIWNQSEGRQERLKQQIDRELEKQWDDLKRGLSPQLRKVSQSVRQFYRKQFELNVIPHPRTKFNKRKAEADLDFQQSQKHRDVVAAESRQLRQDHIEPLRKELEAFSADCRAKLPQDRSWSLANT